MNATGPNPNTPIFPPIIPPPQQYLTPASQHLLQLHHANANPPRPGIRLPFAMQSTIYNDLLAVDLQRLALKSLLTKTALDPAMVDYVLCGTVIQETKTSNIAREASMGAGIPLSVPSHTVTQACISSSVAICTAAEKIMAGQADVVIAGVRAEERSDEL